MINDFLKDLKDRNLLQDSTSLPNKSLSGYIGFDPTAPSLTIGNLVSLITLARFARHGNKPYVVIGTMTGLIGDPSGKNKERQLLDEETVKSNAIAISKSISSIMQSNNIPCVILENHTFYNENSLVDLLRNYAKHMSVNVMLKKDNVKNRLESGITLTEFNYSLLQAYDFCYLAKEHGVELQMGGSDQWGNISSGLGILHKKEIEGYGLTIKLLTDSAGNKIGKSNGNNIWLDRSLTQPFDFYQYWINVDDKDIPNLFYTFSLKPVEEINKILQLDIIEQKHLLATEITDFVHGCGDLCRKFSRIIFGNENDLSLITEINVNKCFNVINTKSPFSENTISELFQTSLSAAKKAIANNRLTVISNGLTILKFQKQVKVIKYET